MEILSNLASNRPKVRAALFDFDGTISTLREGWEDVMVPLMLEMIAGSMPIDDKLTYEVREYVNQSTGIQTIFQMKWLAEKVKLYGRNSSAADDPWWYKEEYNRRLMERVERRRADVFTGKQQPDDYMIKGSVALLDSFKKNGITMYVASGTDHPDVVKEVEVLGLTEYFTEIAGAPPGREDCSKEAVLRQLVEGHKLLGSEVIVLGDGKVEIALGREVGARTLGIASDERKRRGVNPVKRERLIKAGAHAIVGDFEDTDEILSWIMQ